MKDYSISEAEWEIMKILWEKPNITLREIVRDLEGMGWSYSTIFSCGVYFSFSYAYICYFVIDYRR